MTFHTSTLALRVHDRWLSTSTCSPPTSKRPNICLRLCRRLGPLASAYAKLDGPGTINDVVQTPNFDRVAREGVLVSRAPSSRPLVYAVPQRLLSGQHFWRTGRGAILAGAVWDGSNPSFPLMLRDTGYHIGETYKVWSPGTPVDAPYGAGKHAYEKGRRPLQSILGERDADGRQGHAAR